jgi:hypothetical protein
VRRVVLVPSSSRLPPGLSVNVWHATVVDAARQWDAPCADVRFEVADASPRWLASEDGSNLIAFRAESWCHNERCSSTTTYPLRALGMTTIYPEGASGSAVREADVELNGRSPWLRLPGVEHDTSDGASLRAVLVHELGHVLGLADSCEAGHRASGAPKRVACPEEQRERVMYAPARLETPAPADLTDLCRHHPSDERGAQRAEPPIERSGEGSGSWQIGGAVLLLLASVVAFRVLRERSRTRSRRTLLAAPSLHVAGDGELVGLGVDAQLDPVEHGEPAGRDG